MLHLEIKGIDLENQSEYRKVYNHVLNSSAINWGRCYTAYHDEAIELNWLNPLEKSIEITSPFIARFASQVAFNIRRNESEFLIVDREDYSVNTPVMDVFKYLEQNHWYNYIINSILGPTFPVVWWRSGSWRWNGGEGPSAQEIEYTRFIGETNVICTEYLPAAAKGNPNRIRNYYQKCYDTAYELGIQNIIAKFRFQAPDDVFTYFGLEELSILEDIGFDHIYIWLDPQTDGNPNRLLQILENVEETEID